MFCASGLRVCGFLEEFVLTGWLGALGLAFSPTRRAFDVIGTFTTTAGLYFGKCACVGGCLYVSIFICIYIYIYIFADSMIDRYLCMYIITVHTILA